LLSVNRDGTDVKVLVQGLNMSPDGVAVDSEHAIYWTNMGKAAVNDGSIQRANLDGSNVVTIVPVGATFTAKQLKIDRTHGKLYWSDREGMRVMRANLDGSSVETLVQTGDGEVDRKDAGRWCVGVGVDPDRGFVYWTQKGGSNAGQSPASPHGNSQRRKRRASHRHRATLPRLAGADRFGS
jgi:sugar lactone lactonase YvrE